MKIPHASRDKLEGFFYELKESSDHAMHYLNGNYEWVKDSNGNDQPRLDKTGVSADTINTIYNAMREQMEKIRMELMRLTR